MRLDRVLILIAILSLQTKPTMPYEPQATHATSNAAGVWSSGTLEQVGAVQRPECTYLAVTDRKVTLKPVAGTSNFEGEWVRWTRYVWMTSDGLKCRWYTSEDQFEPVLGSIWTYRLEGNISDAQGDALAVHGTYVNCLGNGCSQMSVAAKTFQTELKLIRGTLVDTNATADPSDDVEFLRLSDEAELVDEARTALETSIKLLDSGDIDHFYTTATSSAFRASTSIDQFHSRMSELQKLGLVTSRRYLLTTNVLYAPMITKDRGEYVLLSNTVQTDKNTGGVEFIFLIREQSEWKVYWINYGS